MSEKAATPKAAKAAPARKGLTVRKAIPKKAAAVKASAPAKPAPKAVVPKPEKKLKRSGKAGGKIKVVRDSFTMPQSDYARIGELKRLCQKTGLHVKKSELLRAGLHALGKLEIEQLTESLSRLEKIKTGRPKKSQEK